jgi:hypothetical protein
MREVGICLAPSVRTSSSLAVINTAGELLDLDDAHSDREIAQWMTRWASRHCHVAITPDLLPPAPSITPTAEEVIGEQYVDRVQRLVRLLELDPTPGSAALRRVAPLPADGESPASSSADRASPLPGAAAGRTPSLAGMVTFLESLPGNDVPLFVSGCGKWAALRQACLAPGQTAQAQQLRSGLQAVASAYLARVHRVQPAAAPATQQAWREHIRRGSPPRHPAGDGGSGRRVRRPLLVLEIEGVPEPADRERAGRWWETVARVASTRPQLDPQTRIGLSLTFRIPADTGCSDLDQLVACALNALTGLTESSTHHAAARHGQAIVARAQVDAIEARRRPVRGDELPGMTAQIFVLGGVPATVGSSTRIEAAHSG